MVLTLPLAGGAEELLECRAEDISGVVVLHLSGSLTFDTVRWLGGVLQPAVDQARHIVVDIARVTQIDASGFRVLEAARSAVMERGRTLLLAAPSPRIRRLIDVLGMDQLFPVLQTVGAALEAVGVASRPLQLIRGGASGPALECNNEHNSVAVLVHVRGEVDLASIYVLNGALESALKTGRHPGGAITCCSQAHRHSAGRSVDPRIPLDRRGIGRLRSSIRIAVTVVPRARARRVEATGEGRLRVWVTAPPREGRANAALIEALAVHYGVPRSCVRIVHGVSGRHKLVEIGQPIAKPP